MNEPNQMSNVYNGMKWKSEDGTRAVSVRMNLFAELWLVRTDGKSSQATMIYDDAHARQLFDATVKELKGETT